jgi:hypothetical protein
VLASAAFKALWLGIPLVLLALLGTFRRRFTWLVRAILDYRTLLERVAILSDDLRRASDDLRTLRLQSQRLLEDGRKQGRAEVEGELQSSLVSEVPELLGTQVNADSDIVVLIATWRADPHLTIGTRFELVTEATHELKGTVAVSLVDEAGCVMYLACVDPMPQQYWTALASHAVVDSGPPPRVVLRRIALPFAPVPATAEEAGG